MRSESLSHRLITIAVDVILFASHQQAGRQQTHGYEILQSDLVSYVSL